MYVALDLSLLCVCVCVCVCVHYFNDVVVYIIVQYILFEPTAQLYTVLWLGVWLWVAIPYYEVRYATHLLPRISHSLPVLLGGVVAIAW